MKLAAWRRRRIDGESATTTPTFGVVFSDHVADLGGAFSDVTSLLAGGAPAFREAVRVARSLEPIPVQDIEWLPPIPRPGKIICVGLNYRSHLALLKEPAPEFPVLFTKPATSITASGQPVILPHVSAQVDFEGELAVVIGRRAKYVREGDALAYVGGYTCANDVSAHDIEFRTSQWTSGKMLDTFCPIGAVIATADEIEDPNQLRLRTRLNDVVVQDESTGDMCFSVPRLISYVSSLTTLEPGDLILTGTPAGLGCMREPQVFLKDGDVVEVSIDGVGTLANPVVSEARIGEAAAVMRNLERVSV